MKIQAPWWSWVGGVPEVSPETLKSWLDSGRQLQLIDARTRSEYCSGTISDAWYAPVSSLPASLDELAVSPDIPVVALCLTGYRSRPVVRLLRRKHIEAYSLRGGITCWRMCGFPLQNPDSC